IPNTVAYGTNPAGGVTDVYNASTGSVSVAYVTQSHGDTGLVTAAVQYTLGDGNYQLATANNFGTFGYIKLEHGLSGGAVKYYIHGFAPDALLISRGATLTLDEVNGIGSTPDPNFFQILSNFDLGTGPSSAVNQLPAVDKAVTGSSGAFL